MVRLTVSLPATPGLREMLQDGLRFVLFDRLRHHVQNVMHDSGAELQIVVRLDSLFSHGLGDTLAVSAFELTRKQIAKPTMGALE